MLGARDGVAGNELDAVGQVGADIADHRRLHRSDIGDDGTSLDLRSCLGRERRVRTDRNAEDHQVGALHGLGGITVERVGKAELVDGGARSEEHTSELQSLMRISYAVFCLKKKNRTKLETTSTNNNKTNT